MGLFWTQAGSRDNALHKQYLRGPVPGFSPGARAAPPAHIRVVSVNQTFLQPYEVPLPRPHQCAADGIIRRDQVDVRRERDGVARVEPLPAPDPPVKGTALLPDPQLGDLLRGGHQPPSQGQIKWNQLCCHVREGPTLLVFRQDQGCHPERSERVQREPIDLDRGLITQAGRICGSGARGRSGVIRVPMTRSVRPFSARPNARPLSGRSVSKASIMSTRGCQGRIGIMPVPKKYYPLYVVEKRSTGWKKKENNV